MPAQSHGRSLPSFGFDRSGIPLGERIALLARKVWPAKTAVNLASRTGTTTRAAELVLSGTNGLSGDSLAELLRSDIGFDVLHLILESSDAKPSWWPAFERAVVIADLEKRQDEIHRTLAGLAARPPR